MATTKKTAGQAAAEQRSAAQPNPTPAAGQSGQDSTDAAQQEGDSQGDGEPDYRALYEEAKAQVEQFTTELQAVTGERDNLLADNGKPVIPLYDDPYSELSDESFNTVLEIVLGEAHNRGIVMTAEEDEPSGPAADADADTAPASEASTEPYAEEKDAMRRNGLSKAWVTPEGQVFYAEKHAREWAGTEEVFDTLETITAE